MRALGIRPGPAVGSLLLVLALGLAPDERPTSCGGEEWPDANATACGASGVQARLKTEDLSASRVSSEGAGWFGAMGRSGQEHSPGPK